MSVESCAFLIHQTYDKWDQTPVIVSFAEKFTPVWQIPFPAVTICPQTKVDINLFNFTKEFEEFKEMSLEDRLSHNRYARCMRQFEIWFMNNVHFIQVGGNPRNDAAL